jgi:hypothetical protein
MARSVHLVAKRRRTMTFRIEKSMEGPKTVLRVSGRIGSENLEELNTEIMSNKTKGVLDLQHVTLVDVEAVRFLNACEADGIELEHCSPYIREWMSRERNS